MSKSFYMINKGTCTRVKLYGLDVRNLFLINGYIEKSIDESDYIIINTCITFQVIFKPFFTISPILKEL